ncbi:MAG: pyruvate ferredoxin oxidoreductase [Desulfobacca sp. 4484_104]|nr:MAG: pyruvate ferredoxin oxidoreductase [Desulfobacca sp. 4484_104]RLB71787.1 MAG: pyruvate synthase subunit beta [Deltaproteobacteria bacterium]
MDALNVYAAKLAPQQESLAPGHRACQGCAELLAVRLVAKTLGRDYIIANATGCLEIVTSSFPHSAWQVPWIHVAFENAAAVASGVEAGIKSLKKKGRYPVDRKITIVAQAGDGGTVDIGLQALSGALERGHDFIYICYDNEAYMNTGIQRSSSTPYGAATTTSPAGKESIGQVTMKKNVAEIAVAHDIPYVATASPSYPFDLMEKVRKAADMEGPAYIHVLAPCPTGWRMAPNLAVSIGRLAVETKVFPLYEVVNGEYRMTVQYKHHRPVKDYLKPQGRFRHLQEKEIEFIQQYVDASYEKLLKKIAMSEG